MILRRSPATKEKFARSALWSPSRAKIHRPGASPSSGSARASSVAERRYKSSVLVGTSKTPPSTSGSATGISGTCSGTGRMLYWPSCFSGRWPSISFSCSSIGGLVVAADPRTLLIPSGISSKSCFANWPLFPSLFLGGRSCSTAADAAPDPRQLGGADAPAPNQPASSARQRRAAHPKENHLLC